MLSLFTDKSFLSSEERDQITTVLEEIARRHGADRSKCRCELRSGDECVQGARESTRLLCEIPEAKQWRKLVGTTRRRRASSAKQVRLPPTSTASVSPSIGANPRSCVTAGSCSLPTRRWHSEYELGFARIRKVASSASARLPPKIDSVSRKLDTDEPKRQLDRSPHFVGRLTQTRSPGVGLRVRNGNRRNPHRSCSPPA